MSSVVECLVQRTLIRRRARWLSGVVTLVVVLTASCCWASGASARTELFWGGHGIGATNPDGPRAPGRDLFSRDGGQAVAVFGGEMYFIHDRGFEIGRAEIGTSTLSDEQRSVVTDIPHGYPYDTLTGLTVAGDYIYWTWVSYDYCETCTGTTGGIGRAKLNGADSQPDWLVGLNQPEAVTVSGNEIYWTDDDDTGFESGSIGRAQLNGSGAPSHINDYFVNTRTANSSNQPYVDPLGLTVSGGHIYWAYEIQADNPVYDSEAENPPTPLTGTPEIIVSGGIGSAQLNGTGAASAVHQHLIGGLIDATGVVVDGDHIYWDDSRGLTIGRAEISGSHVSAVKPEFIRLAGDPTGLAVSAKPQNVTVPVISGTTVVGDTLTVTTANADWLNNPATYTYRWKLADAGTQSCTTVYPAQTSASTTDTLTLTSADIGCDLEVTVSATNIWGTSSSVTSTVTGLIAPLTTAVTSIPTITGTDTEGDTLTVTDAVFSNGGALGSRTWMDCSNDTTTASCTTVAGQSDTDDPAGNTATNLTSYELVHFDVGKYVRVMETGVNGANSVTTWSAATPMIAGLPPQNVQAPSIAGDLTEGQTLTAVNGEWSDGPVTETDGWSPGPPCSTPCVNAPPTVESTYPLTSDNVGQTFTLEGTASNAFGSVMADSATTGAVQPYAPTDDPTAPTLSLPPVIIGVPVDDELSGPPQFGFPPTGATLTVSSGAWEGTPLQSSGGSESMAAKYLLYTYTWEDCTTAPTTVGASASCDVVQTDSSEESTSDTYTVASGLDSPDLYVFVTAVNEEGKATSPPVEAQIYPNPTVHIQG